MMSTSIDPHNNSNHGRPLRIVSTNRLFTKVRTEQPTESGIFKRIKFEREREI